MNKREIDSALIKTASGDNDAFERLYEETKRGVYSYLFSYFDNVADCEDAMQDTYLKIKQNINRYTPGTNGLAWILQIAKNTALNALRSKRLRENCIVYAEEPTTGLENYELKETLTTIMKRVLDEDEQRIIILHAIWGYKHKEIAKIMDKPVGTVTSKYKRAVDKLKTAWKEER